ncbi:hypothetical protein [Treponema pedis]|uniref:Uncharacterized protein n=1 Tax=Treponema pedis str. T A4 TaxID=1291379 RepID=S5ZLZ3_9SPIR|nr:hypothetical protein [Treponema pedis]AGT43582.1 hypothetical protein TPE_1086 [Treponema pedis str. T A4]
MTNARRSIDINAKIIIIPPPPLPGRLGGLQFSTAAVALCGRCDNKF